MIKFISKQKNPQLNTESEFSWVLKVLSSSTNLSQVTTSQQLFKNYLTKWENILDLRERSKKSLEFTGKKTEILSKILKKVDF